MAMSKAIRSPASVNIQRTCTFFSLSEAAFYRRLIYDADNARERPEYLS
jgi:hypothetical protein